MKSVINKLLFWFEKRFNNLFVFFIFFNVFAVVLVLALLKGNNFLRLISLLFVIPYFGIYSFILVRHSKKQHRE